MGKKQKRKPRKSHAKQAKEQLEQMPILNADQAWQALQIAVALDDEIYGQSILLTRELWAADQSLAEKGVQLFDNLADAWVNDAKERQMEPEQVEFFETFFAQQKRMYRQLVRDNLKTDMFISAWDNGALDGSSGNETDNGNNKSNE